VFAENGVKDLVDCVLGVKAGVERNGRKDRGGKEKVGISSLEPFSGRRFDFVIRGGSRLIPIETNFYGSLGSKLKAVAGEFVELKQPVLT
jgi:type II restriction enzyme